jgi:hypothetical protein
MEAALSGFYAMKRVTITPAAHGWFFAPLYGTPFIRNLPCGLIILFRVDGL